MKRARFISIGLSVLAYLFVNFTVYAEITGVTVLDESYYAAGSIYAGMDTHPIDPPPGWYNYTDPLYAAGSVHYIELLQTPFPDPDTGIETIDIQEFHYEASSFATRGSAVSDCYNGYEASAGGHFTFTTSSLTLSLDSGMSSSVAWGDLIYASINLMDNTIGEVLYRMATTAGSSSDFSSHFEWNPILGHEYCLDFSTGGYGTSSTGLNVNIIPEPATLALFGLGGLLLRRKK